MILCGWVLTLLNIVTVDPDAVVVDATDMDVGYTAVVNNCPGVGLLLPGGCCNLYLGKKVNRLIEWEHFSLHSKVPSF